MKDSVIATDARMPGNDVVMADGGSLADWLPPHFYNAKECGGGAMIDLGAHGMYLARWLLGKPVKITSTFNKLTGREVEDNAISVIEFENKALAINETSFAITLTASPRLIRTALDVDNCTVSVLKRGWRSRSTAFFRPHIIRKINKFVTLNI